MARMARLILPGVPHHVTQRGNRRQRVFFSVDDYQNYLNLLFASADAFKFDIWSYCLMPNHVHLLLVPETEDSLRDGVAYLHKMYTRSINQTRGWKGCLWQGRFFSCVVEPQGVSPVARYIELNPVRAGLSNTAKDYRCSSAEIACRGGADGRSGFSPIFAPGGTWEQYLNYDPKLDAVDKLNAVRRAVNSGRPYGSKDYIKDLEAKLGLTLEHKRPGRKPQADSKVISLIF
jgi:putative transposase